VLNVLIGFAAEVFVGIAGEVFDAESVEPSLAREDAVVSMALIRVKD
jgi:hypothetical protein